MRHGLNMWPTCKPMALYGGPACKFGTSRVKHNWVGCLNNLTQMLTNKKMLTPRVAVLIEEATKGAFKAKVFRPDVFGEVDPKQAEELGNKLDAMRDAKKVIREVKDA